MTVRERMVALATPILPRLYGVVRRRIRRLAARSGRRPFQLLDIGGRSSLYTAGLRVDVTVLDLPRTRPVQHQLGLGLNDALVARIRARSNVVDVHLADFTQNELPDDAFDGIVSVEVIEHVPEDELFVQQAARVLEPGGWFFLTTPNGDYIKNEPPAYNPDHLRHYTRDGLDALLRRHFDDVEVTYAIRTGRLRVWGLGGLSPRRPLRSARSAVSNVLHRVLSRPYSDRAPRRAHLFAVARQPR